LDARTLLGASLSRRLCSLAAQDQCAAIGRWEAHVEYLHGADLIKHGPGSDAGCQRFDARTQRDVKT